jgi:RNA polymerase sigma-70 factor (ECF subfamily)
MPQLQFEDYYRMNHRALTSFALKLTNNKMDADDLVQETALKAFKNFNKFIEGSNFKNWTFTILKNTFVTKYNKRKKSKVVSLPVEEMEFAVLSDSTTEEKSSKSTRYLYVSSKLEQLSDKSKEPLVMYINGFQYQEIADSLDIPLGTVKSRINYARTKLKKELSRKAG